VARLNRNIVRFFKVALILLLAGVFIAATIATTLSHKDLVCTNILIEIDHKNNLYFLDENDVNKILTRNSKLINTRLSDINLSQLEKDLEENDFIQNAEVFTNFDGVLKAKIQQKTPQYRIFNNEGVSYYISDSGNFMPLSSKFTPRLIVATGYIPFVKNIEVDAVNKDLKLLIDFIQRDEFLNALIGSVHVNSKKEFVLIPKIDGHKIDFGKINDMETKFRNLKIFYKKALPYSEWEKYETINLKYKGQIVCSKN
jgi:cell division protein FtsQ